MDRPLDFAIIGAQKAGTTSLHDILRRHSDLFLPEEKDFVVFMDGEPANTAPREMQEYFREARAEQLLGLSYVDLLYMPECPARMHRHNPGMRLIAILRDPVSRAWSNFHYNRSRGRESCPTFGEALDREEERARGSWRDRMTRTYLSHGLYAEQLERFLTWFPRERIHVMLFEEFVEEPDRVVGDVLRFLGAKDDVPLALETRRNVASSPRWAALQRVMWSPPPPLLRAYRCLPLSLRRLVRYSVVARLDRLNLSPEPNPPMEPEDRQRLMAYFAGPNRRLEGLLGRELTGWS